jgi:hypothetical protein
MATYTAEQLKEFTSVPAVSTWSDEKILHIQARSEAILVGKCLDDSLPGYAEAYVEAVLAVFDWLADNPTSRRSDSQGKVSRQFSNTLPEGIMELISPYIMGGKGGAGIIGAQLQRSDIGLR